MPRILISYRREDSAAYAGRLFDRLSDRFGADNIFIDIDAIKPGQDFVQTIGESVFTCDAVLAVIGRHWLGEKDTAGQRRIDRPDDLVRMEIAAALNRGIQVIPVLVGGGEMPQALDLPADLTKLGRLQALELSDARFHHDVHRLIEALAGIRESGARDPGRSPASREPRDGVMAKWRWGVAAAAVVVVLWAAYRQLPSARGSEQRPRPASTTTEPQDGPRATNAEQGARPVTAASTAQAAELSAADGLSAVAENGLDVVQGPPPPVRPLQALGTIDKPQPIDLGVTYSFALDGADAVYLSVPVAVNGLAIIVDMRPTKRSWALLESDLSVLDRDGGVLQDRAIRFSNTGWGVRKTGAIAIKQKSPLGLKLVNGGMSDTYWLTVFNTARIPFVPMFGGITPGPLAVGQSVSGSLDSGDGLYYRVALKKGTYKAILDFTNTPQRYGLIQGTLAILDQAGGNPQEVFRLTAADVAFRKVGTITIKRDTTAIVYLANDESSTVKFGFRLTADDGA